MAFDALPEAFNRVEFRAVRRKKLRSDVVSVDGIRFVQAGFAEDQPDLAAFLRNLFGHGVEECLEHPGVTVRDDQTHQLTASRVAAYRRRRTSTTNHYS